MEHHHNKMTESFNSKSWLRSFIIKVKKKVRKKERKKKRERDKKRKKARQRNREGKRKEGRKEGKKEGKKDRKEERKTGRLKDRMKEREGETERGTLCTPGLLCFCLRARQWWLTQIPAVTGETWHRPRPSISNKASNPREPHREHSRLYPISWAVPPHTGVYSGSSKTSPLLLSKQTCVCVCVCVHTTLYADYYL